MQTILTITGSDSGSGSGIQADIKTISALGGYALSAITSITVQNTLGIQDIYDLPADVVKAQIVFREGSDLPESLKVLHRSHVGKVETAIIRGSQETVSAALSAINPIFFDLVPLTLEEVFVYELGGVDYEVKNVVL